MTLWQGCENSYTLNLDYTLMNFSSRLTTKDLKRTHEEVLMEKSKEIAEEFKCKHVYSHIVSAE